MEKMFRDLHEYLQKDILDESVQLQFREGVGSCFVVDDDEIDDFTIVLDWKDGMKNNILEVYLHEAAHAFHYFEFTDDWEEKEDLYTKLTNCMYEKVPANTMQDFYENMVLEKEANELAKILMVQLRKDWLVGKFDPHKEHKILFKLLS